MLTIAPYGWQALHCSAAVSGTPTLNHTGELNAAFWLTAVRQLVGEDRVRPSRRRSSRSSRPQPRILSTTRETS